VNAARPPGRREGTEGPPIRTLDRRASGGDNAHQRDPARRHPVRRRLARPWEERIVSGHVLTCRPFLAAAAATFVAVFAAGSRGDPEPGSVGKPEQAAAAVDPVKAKTDKKLAKKEADNLAASRKNLAKIGQAAHDYASNNADVLPDDLRDNKGRPLLSWRVALLPHLGEKKLYESFRLDQPWDSPHNKKLLARMPEVFASPRVKLKGKGVTVYEVFQGPDAVFGRGRPMRVSSIPDGTSNTIMVVEASTAVPWTRPGGLPFARNKAVPQFGKAYGDKPLCALFDGSTRVLDLRKIQERTLKNAIDPADGQPLGKDWDE
jgi:hypothetical protein